jgi:hypothetical protein
MQAVLALSSRVVDTERPWRSDSCIDCVPVANNTTVPGRMLVILGQQSREKKQIVAIKAHPQQQERALIQNMHGPVQLTGY